MRLRIAQGLAYYRPSQFRQKKVRSTIRFRLGLVERFGGAEASVPPSNGISNSSRFHPKANPRGSMYPIIKYLRFG